MGRDEQCDAAVGGEGVEEVPQVPAEHGVEADGRLVQDQEFGVAEERDREGYPAASAAGEVPGEHVGVRGEGDVVEGAVDRLLAGGAGRPSGVQYLGEVREVLADGEVVVHGRRLRDVAGPGTQRGVSGGPAEDVERAGDVRLGAGDRAHEGGLAAAGGAEEAGDLPAGDVEVEGGQDRTAAAYHREAACAYGRGGVVAGYIGRIEPARTARRT